MTPTTTKSRPAAPRPKPRPPIDPRISARRTAVTREQGRRRLHVLVGLLIATALLVGGWFLLHSSLLSARAITVVGATHETAAQVEAAANLSSHRPLVDINTGAAAAAIEQLPWVRRATVQVQWPDGVRVVINEEVPMLTMSTADGKWVEISADGRVLALSATRPPGLMLLTGPQPAGAVGTTLADTDGPGLSVATTLPISFRAQVTGVHVEPGGWVQLSMTTPIVVDIGLPTQLTAKYEDVSSILAGATLHDGAIIDVSVPDAPTVTQG
jgi:cell division protein FtsQ